MSKAPDTRAKALGKIIRQCREREGWSMRDLEQRSGLSVQTISNVESGRHFPTPATVIKLAQALGNQTNIPTLLAVAGYAEPEPQTIEAELLRLLRRAELSESAAHHALAMIYAIREQEKAGVKFVSPPKRTPRKRS